MFEITREVVQAAETYAELATKIGVAAELSALCITDMSYSIDVGGVNVDVPDYLAKNVPAEKRILLGALFKLYLKIPFDPVEGTDYLMAQDDYDRAMRLHPMNTLERFKGDKEPEVKAKVFDLLRDYKELKDMACYALESTIEARNDPVARYLAAQTMMITPEALQTLTKAEEGLRERLDSLKETGAEAGKILSTGNKAAD